MNQQAVRMCLSDKVLDKKLMVLEDFQADGKTKTVAKLRELLPGKGKTVLWLVPKSDDMTKRSTRNIEKLDLQLASDVNVIDLLHHQYVVVIKTAVDVLEKRLAK